METPSKKIFGYKSSTVWTFAIIAIIALVAWTKRDAIKKALGIGQVPETPTKPPSGGSGNPSSGNSTTTTTTGLDYDKIIKLTNPTMKGAEEKLLQQMLNQEMVYRKAQPVTPPAINEAHNDVPLVTDGIVGDKTINLLFKYTGMREGSLNTIKAKLNTMVTIPSVSSLWGG